MRRFRPLALTVTFLAVPLRLLAEAATDPLVPPPLPDASTSVLRVAGALMLVLAVFFGGVWLFRNWQRCLRIRGRAPRLSILEGRSLGNRHHIYIVGCEQQRFLVATSPGGVTLLNQLPNVETEVFETEPAPSFLETWQKTLARK